MQFALLHVSPEWSVRLDDDLVVAVGDGQLEGALLVATLEMQFANSQKEVGDFFIQRIFYLHHLLQGNVHSICLPY